MPQRHSKNNNDLSVFTYEERRKLGFGTQKERVGKDSIKPFDVCCLCLQELKDPLCCQKGHLFCRECIYSSLLSQKKGIKRKLAAFMEQQKEDKDAADEEAVAARERQLAAFDRQNSSAAPLAATRDAGGGGSGAAAAAESPRGPGFHGANSVKATAFEEESLRTMKAYWLPCFTPEAAERKEAPSTDTVCPQGNEKLRLKDLFPVSFLELADRGEEDGPPAPPRGGGGKYMCPSCSATLTNASTLTAVATCGHVFCKKCADQFVARDGCCLRCSAPCERRHLIALEKGGTGFAGHGDKLAAVAFKHLGSGSGAAPLRPVTKLR